MTESPRPANFLAAIIEADLAAGRNGGRVVTRFPPEPNGYLHIGHSKSILLNHGLARQFAGRMNLRFDDTNPTAEDIEYVRSIQEDVRWLGADWGEHLYFASDYFERMFECAVRLIQEGEAYVDTQSVDAIREQRGSFERPGTHSPHRDRPAAESLDLFRRMRAGEFEDGACVLRARIDMSHPNVLMRDPLLYRIRHAHHHRTGDRWCLYPMYDYAHPLEDAFEGVTHSICTLEFESNRELYDWVLDHLGPWDPRPRQYEFARLALGYTVMSKRKLLQIVNERRVSGWDDPRMPTIAGMRRRGVTPEALRDFAEMIGVAKNNSVVDIGKLEFAIRNDLEARAPRAMAVLDPLPLTIESWPADSVEELEVPWWPGEPARGTRRVPFGRDLLVEREDFALEPPPDWRRLAPGREIRLAGAYVVRCEGAERDAAGEIRSIRCTHVPGSASDGGEKRRVAGTVHWVHASRSLPAEVRLYDRLFRVEQPDAEGDFLQALNPDSLVRAAGARVEPALAQVEPGTRWQFLRQGYFFADPVESRAGAPVFNRTITLKDSWASRGAREKEDARRPRARKGAAEAAPVAAQRSRGDARATLHAENPDAAARFRRYHADLGLGEADADLLSGDAATAQYFDTALAAHGNPRSLARWLLNDLAGLTREARLEDIALPPSGFAAFVALVDAGRLTTAAGKALLAHLVAQGGSPEERMRELGLEKVEDRGAVGEAIAAVMSEHAREVTRFRSGESKLFGMLLGAVMRRTQGAADPALVRQLLEERLARS